ncbi:hypothetical protein L1887_20014 [Cichorium endivia]|nr:hypothetical protein L1887_20014 [Cichorium endivia]
MEEDAPFVLHSNFVFPSSSRYLFMDVESVRCLRVCRICVHGYWLLQCEEPFGYSLFLIVSVSEFNIGGVQTLTKLSNITDRSFVTLILQVSYLDC